MGQKTAEIDIVEVINGDRRETFRDGYGIAGFHDSYAGLRLLSHSQSIIVRLGHIIN